MRVLVVKLTSMGDLVHALPALTDAAKAIPGIRFDWAVDRAFAEVPSWHTHVDKTIITAHRAWKKDLWKTIKDGELKKFAKDLRAENYDLIIDAQGSYKSAIVGRFAKGNDFYGMDKYSVREKFAYLLYKKKFAIPKRQHAIERLRQLFADSLGYTRPTSFPEFGIDLAKIENVELPIQLPKNYLVFVHNISWESKAWPEDYWHDLINRTLEQGLEVLLPWGNQQEFDRATRLAENKTGVHVLPRLNLTQQAHILLHAKGAVCCDTGLSHIAAALNVPAITLYGSTDPFLIGTTGQNQTHLASDFECVKCYKVQCEYPNPTEQRPACFTKLPPALVWEYVMSKIIA